MNMLPTPEDDDMPAEINFSAGVRGKFFQAAAKSNLPVYLDAEVHAYLLVIAARKGIQVSEVANHLLRHCISTIKSLE